MAAADTCINFDGGPLVPKNLGCLGSRSTIYIKHTTLGVRLVQLFEVKNHILKLNNGKSGVWQLSSEGDFLQNFSL